jgi:hypothetical protein
MTWFKHKPKAPPKKREMLGYRIVVQCQHNIVLTSEIISLEQANTLASDLIEAGASEWFCFDSKKQIFVKPFMVVSFEIKPFYEMPRIPTRWA